MEFSISIFWVLFILLPFLCLIYNKKSQLAATAITSKPPLPPGNTGWPLIGETLEYLSTFRNGVPEKFIEDRKIKYSTKVFKTSLVGESMAILCSAEGNKFLFSNENKLVQTWWPRAVNKIFPNSENGTSIEESKRLRKVVSAVLKPDAIQRNIGVMDAVAKQHLKTDWNREEVKVHPLMRKYTFMLACQLFFGIEDPELVAKLEKPFSKIAAGVVSIPVNFPGTTFSRAIKAARELRKEFENMIKQRKIDILEQKVSKTQDILSLMLLYSDENGQCMNELQIANKIIGLTSAGHDTSSITLVSTIKYLAELPEIYELVLSEQKGIANSKGPEDLLNWEDIKKMKYSWNVVSEVLRLSPALQGGFKEAITDFNYGGYLIPKGWKLHWNAYTTHTNSEYFPNPEKFDPSRYEGDGPAPYAYVPFGGGPRMCPGKEYARLAILVFIHNLVTKFKWEKVFPDEKLIIDPVLMPTKGLPVRLYPHKP